MIQRYLLFMIFLAAFLFVAASSQRPAKQATGIFGEKTVPDRSAVIKFSHQFHITEAGVTECSICHDAAERSMNATDNPIPTKATCATCHDVEDPEQCTKCHYDEDYVTYAPSSREIIFPHATHVGEGMECTTCHRDLEDTDYATDANLPDMETCSTCHNDQKVTNQCESCHLNFVTLFPDDHRASNFLRGHRQITRIGGLDVSCQTCHTERFCQDCHLDGGLKAFGPSDLMTDPRPKTSPLDSPDKMSLQSVHELNYRFTHGIDARGKSADCVSCHSQQAFCAPCHEAGGNVTQGNFRPATHLVPGFTTLGRGTGGGLHAEQAKRDMESCIACHDVEGRDPVCLVCHDPGGRVR